MNLLKLNLLGALVLYLTPFAISAELPDNLPSVTTAIYDKTDTGYIYLTTAFSSESVGNYIVAYDNDGTPVKYKEIPNDNCHDFKMLPNGQLSYAESVRPLVYNGHDGFHVTMDNDLNNLDSFYMKNEYWSEVHDFQLLPNGHALLFGYYETRTDISKFIEGAYPNALVSGGVIQELDQDKNVVWQWRSWDHFTAEGHPWNPFSSKGYTVSAHHLNAISMDYDDGNILIGTPDWSAKINRQTGDFMWIAGVLYNDFTFVGVDSAEGADDMAGHTFYKLDNGNYLVYDNAPFSNASGSDAHEYSLDEENLIATKVKTWSPSETILGNFMGSAQRLPNGNTLVGWGGTVTQNKLPACTEFDTEGNTVFELSFDDEHVWTYRAFRFPLEATAKYEGLHSVLAIGGSYEFKDTDTDSAMGVSIEISDLISLSYNSLYVTTKEYAPVNPRFTNRAPIVLPKTVVIEQQAINLLEGIVQFTPEEFGIKNPEDITIYYRETVGEGTFTSLTTRYNNITGIISADFENFGEFIFTYPDVTHAIVSPITAFPLKGASVPFYDSARIEWSPSGFCKSFTLEIASDSTFEETLVSESELTSTVYYLEQPKANTTYFWRVKTTNDAGESDWSDTAMFYCTASDIELISPNGNEVLTRGLNTWIKWESNFTEEVVLDLYQNDTFYVTIDTVENNSALKWEVPADIDSACNYYMSIRSINDSAINDASDSLFSINADACQSDVIPLIKVVAPNGGEDIQGYYTIKWINNTNENVDIILYNKGIEISTIASDASGNEFSWSVANMNYLNGYRIKVVTKSGLYSDISNNDFDIAYAPGFSNTQNIRNFQLYPNPSNGNITLKLELDKAAKARINVFDATGKKVISYENEFLAVGANTLEYNLSALKQGLYYIQAVVGNDVYSQRVSIVK